MPKVEFKTVFRSAITSWRTELLEISERHGALSPALVRDIDHLMVGMEQADRVLDALFDRLPDPVLQPTER